MDRYLDVRGRKRPLVASALKDGHEPREVGRNRLLPDAPQLNFASGAVPDLSFVCAACDAFTMVDVEHPSALGSGQMEAWQAAHKNGVLSEASRGASSLEVLA